MKIGCKNKVADLAERVNNTWSDTNPTGKYNEFYRFVCTCGNNERFEVLGSNEAYETLVKCLECGKYYIIHAG